MKMIDLDYINSEFEKFKNVIESNGSIFEPITKDKFRAFEYSTLEVSLFRHKGYKFRTFLKTPLPTRDEHIDCFIPTEELEQSVDLRQFIISTMTNFYDRNNITGYENKLPSVIDNFVEYFNTRDHHAKEVLIKPNIFNSED